MDFKVLDLKIFFLLYPVRGTNFVFVRTLPERWSPVLRILIGLITGFDLGKFIVFLKFVDNDGLKLKHVCEGEFEFLELIWVRVVSKVCLINITAYG